MKRQYIQPETKRVMINGQAVMLDIPIAGASDEGWDGEVYAPGHNGDWEEVASDEDFDNGWE